jgi:hypothetical protein
LRAHVTLPTVRQRCVAALGGARRGGTAVLMAGCVAALGGARRSPVRVTLHAVSVSVRATACERWLACVAQLREAAAHSKGWLDGRRSNARVANKVLKTLLGASSK